MKKIAIPIVMVMVVGLVSISGCIDTSDYSNNTADNTADNNMSNSASVTAAEAKSLALAHVKERMAEANSPELNQQVSMSWLSEPVKNSNDNSYTVSVHVPGVGAMVPDFNVYVASDGSCTDNLPSNWASTGDVN